MELGYLYKNRSIIKIPFVQNISLPQMETTSGYKQESVTAALELFLWWLCLDRLGKWHESSYTLVKQDCCSLCNYNNCYNWLVNNWLLFKDKVTLKHSYHQRNDCHYAFGMWILWKQSLFPLFTSQFRTLAESRTINVF